MNNRSEGFEQKDFEKPHWLFRFALAVIRPLITGPRLFGPFVDSLNLKGNERALELGCGNGVFMTYLARALDRGGSAVGVDTSSYMTERAMKRLQSFKNTEIIRGDVLSLDLEAESFDLVTFINVLHDIRPELRGKTVAALARLLKRGGRLCLMEPVSPSHGMPVEEIRSVVESAGLRITETIRMGRRVRFTCLKSMDK